ncbi:amidohydrolase family protein [Leucobacter denitrificans]|uniref:Amidohydrolase family protein n=1 Tax=Leucobacter denitrificans TaxID=683042 RepID=A0A7G9S2C9_9MICO|nr:amidohydrolase family protein [Leucobacter denitrificans]QNN62004.1 amidohydrolase family protein [Leucobacter denitrificans]
MAENPEVAPVVYTPGLVDAHIHPDKTGWAGPWMSRRPASTLQDFIANDLATQREFAETVEARAYALFSHALRNGTLAMRAHVDVSSELGTANVEGVRAAAERLAPHLTVQIVAFPQFGLLTNPGTLDAMAASLTAGADLVGGIDPIGVDGDMAGHLDAVFGLADRAGRDIDIHLHDGGEEGLAQIREIAARTVAAGLQGCVTIGHAFALCDSTLPSLRETLERVAEAEMWIATCALGPDPVPDLGLFEQHGVRLAAGSDGVRDSWSPFGTGSMVDRAHLLAYRTGAITDAELERAFRLSSTAGGEMLRIPDLATWDGASGGTYLEFHSQSIAQLVVDRPVPFSVVRRGHPIHPNSSL